MKKLSLSLLLISSILLISCGGGGGNSDAGTDTTDTTDTGTDNNQLYIGYYTEDKATNPEDPTTGSLYLNIPKNNGTFSGSMSFSYVGCQTSNVGSISGNKTSNTLTGNWSGTIDGTSQNGVYTGSLNSTDGYYTGDYNVSAGKQHITVDNCIDYFIAPKGKWYLYPENTTITFDNSVASSCSVDNNVVSWFPPAGYSYSVLSIINKESAVANLNNAIVYQQLFTSATSVQLPSNLTSGKKYSASVVSVNSTGKVIYVSNKDFVKD